MIGFAARRPVVFALAATVVPLAMIKVLDSVLPRLDLSPLAVRLAGEAGLAGYVAVLLFRLRWWREAGFGTFGSGRRLAACLPFLLLPLIVVAANGVKAAPAGQVAGFTLFAILVGFGEEGLVRGIVLRGLLPLGLRRATVLSSLLFGAGHLANVFQGADPMTTAVQATYATLLGIGVAGARLYTGVIWPMIALHTLVDLADFAGRGFALPAPRRLAIGDAVVPIILTGLCALYGWWLLTRHERDRA